MNLNSRITMILIERAIIVLFLGLSFASHAAAQTYTDNFESATIDPFWTQTQQYGTLSLSNGQAHSGSQSVKFTSSDGGQREMHLSHNFASPTKGDFSIYFYDVAPGQETLYEKLYLYNSNTTDSASIGTQDFDAHCYTVSLYNYNTNVQQGPNGTCGIYPQTSTTNVSRTSGWHRFEINVASGSVSFSIDGTAVFTAAGDYNFDSVDLGVSGPVWRPNTTAYFDEFNFTQLVSFNVCPLFDQMKAYKSGSTLPVKLQLCDVNGNDVSSSTIDVRAVSLIMVSTNAEANLADAGNANPDSNFRFDETLGDTGGYIFNLSLKDLASGTYLLNFTAGTDPTVYSVTFQVK